MKTNNDKNTEGQGQPGNTYTSEDIALAALNSARAGLEAAKKYEQAFRETLEARIRLIPEDKRSLVPDLDPIALGQWLDQNEQLLKQRQAPGLDEGRSGGRQGQGEISKKDLKPTAY
jgi:hypothetical protein